MNLRTLYENKKVLGNGRFLIDAEAERSGHQRRKRTKEEEDGESGGEGGRRTRTEGPVPGQFLERFVRNFGRGGTLSSWYSNTVRVVGSMRGKKVKQRSAMNGIGY